jgi:hypothetical protein
VSDLFLEHNQPGDGDRWENVRAQLVKHPVKVRQLPKKFEFPVHAAKKILENIKKIADISFLNLSGARSERQTKRFSH